MGDVRTLAPGRAEGVALVLDGPLSFWGGIETETGRLKDVHHPQHDAIVTGRILVLPSGRGSSSSSSVLAETIRLGTGPAAIVLGESDPILALAAIVARELYGAEVPVVVAEPTTYAAITDGRHVIVEAAADRARIDVGN